MTLVTKTKWKSSALINNLKFHFFYSLSTLVVVEYEERSHYSSTENESKRRMRKENTIREQRPRYPSSAGHGIFGYGHAVTRSPKRHGKKDECVVSNAMCPSKLVTRWVMLQGLLGKIPLSKYMDENSVGQENRIGFLEIKISLMNFAIAPLT
jgi:hypothetical protein